MGRQTFVPSNGLVIGALDSQSLGPGSMLRTEVCLLTSSPELSIYPSAGANVIYINIELLFKTSRPQGQGRFTYQCSQ